MIPKVALLVLGDNANDGFAHLNEAYTHQNAPHPRAEEALTISKLFLQRQNKGRELSLTSVANTITADEWMMSYEKLELSPFFFLPLLLKVSTSRWAGHVSLCMRFW